MGKHTRNRGFLRPDELYTTQGVMRAIGLGRTQLLEARESGIVVPVFYGGTAYYRGSELIEFITSQGKPMKRAKPL